MPDADPGRVVQLFQRHCVTVFVVVVEFAGFDGAATPDGDLYRPPDPLPAGAPGTLIWAEKVEIPELNPPATVWRMLYHSRSEQGRDIAVSGFAVVPTAAPTGERPVFAWAHGTVGLGDECAPSHEIREQLAAVWWTTD